MRWFKRYPMTHFLFTFRGVESRDIFTFNSTANIETQAEWEAQDLLQRQHGEDMQLLSTVALER